MSDERDTGENGPATPDEPRVSNRWRRRGRRAASSAGDGLATAPTGRRWARRLGIALGVGAVFFGLLWITLPDPRGYVSEWPERTAYMERWLEGAEAGGRSVEYRPVPLSRIPETLRRAVLVSEDAGFYGHGGFDWHEVGAAIREAWEEREMPRGASTITQQLARNLYLSPSRNPFRKLREALITRRIESRLSKNRILELYLSVIEFGPGVYGVEAASRRYFGKSVSALTRREAAELAATIPSPRGNNPATRTRSFQWRARLAYARAFGGIEIDTLGAPPDTIEVAPPTLADSIGAPGTDTAASDTTTTETASDDDPDDSPAPDTARTDTVRRDTTRRGDPRPAR